MSEFCSNFFYLSFTGAYVNLGMLMCFFFVFFLTKIILPPSAMIHLWQFTMRLVLQSSEIFYEECNECAVLSVSLKFSMCNDAI